MKGSRIPYSQGTISWTPHATFDDLELAKTVARDEAYSKFDRLAVVEVHEVLGSVVKTEKLPNREFSDNYRLKIGVRNV